MLIFTVWLLSRVRFNIHCPCALTSSARACPLQHLSVKARNSSCRIITRDHIHDGENQSRNFSCAHKNEILHRSNEYSSSTVQTSRSIRFEQHLVETSSSSFTSENTDVEQLHRSSSDVASFFCHDFRLTSPIVV
jgi:hypothetical protein